MLEEAWKLLEFQFNTCFDIVKEDDFYRGYALEKWRHSKQVAGTGNYIVSKVEWLKDKSAEYVEMVRCAVLLHDVCRFSEIVCMYRKAGKYDHGVGAAEMLKNTALFNDIRIWLPIKHHGHLIESLYEDVEYQNIKDKQLQEEVEKICFIIRDADKIANFYMSINEPKNRDLFFGDAGGDAWKNGQVSEITRASAFRGETTPRIDNPTPADRVTCFLSWFTDINYQYSMDYCYRLNIVENLFKLFDEFCLDEEFKNQYKTFLTDYLNKRQFLH